MGTKIMREAMKVVASSGLEVTEVINGGRHFQIHCREPERGFTGKLTLHMGTKECKYAMRGLKADIRAIKRGTYHEHA